MTRDIDWLNLGEAVRSCMLTLMLLLSIQSVGQGEVRTINLETVLQIAGADNLTIQSYQLQQELAMADVEKAKEWWLPDLYAGATIDQRWGAAMNSDGRFFTDVDNQNFWGGIGLDASWNFGEGPYALKAKEYQSKATEEMTKAKRNQVLLSVIETYYEMLTAQLVEGAYADLLALSDTMVMQLEVQVDAGLRYQSDLLIAQSNRSHLQLQMLNAQMDYSEAEIRLLQELQLPMSMTLQCEDKLLVPLVLEGMDGSLDSAYQRRPEFLASTYLQKSLAQQRKIHTTGLLLPELRVGGFISEFGDVFAPLYGTSGLQGSLMWRIPIGSLLRSGDMKIVDAQAMLLDNSIQRFKAEVDMEVMQAIKEIEQATARMEIADTGVNASEEALRQAVQRQKNGLVVPFEMLQIQEVYLRAKLDRLDAIAGNNIAQYSLWVARGEEL